MRRLLPRALVVVVVVLVLVAAGAALAARGDPQKRITPADQARARAMLLRPADLPAYRVLPAASDTGDFYCPALDASALTLTGEAAGKRLVLDFVIATSSSEVWESRADAQAAWRKSTNAAGVACARTVLRREFAKQGARLESLRQVPFPRVASRTVAFRVSLLTRTPQGEVPIILELVALMHSRAHATVAVSSALVPPDRPLTLQLARTTAKRMARAMRGA
jgi:hypothetical protein